MQCLLIHGLVIHGLVIHGLVIHGLVMHGLVIHGLVIHGSCRRIGLAPWLHRKVPQKGAPDRAGRLCRRRVLPGIDRDAAGGQGFPVRPGAAGQPGDRGAALAQRAAETSASWRFQAGPGPAGRQGCRGEPGDAVPGVGGRRRGDPRPGPVVPRGTGCTGTPLRSCTTPGCGSAPWPCRKRPAAPAANGYGWPSSNIAARLVRHGRRPHLRSGAACPHLDAFTEAPRKIRALPAVG